MTNLKRVIKLAIYSPVREEVYVFFFGSQTFLNLTNFYTKIAIYMTLNYYIIELHVKINLAISI
jgi:hypothetical protein